MIKGDIDLTENLDFYRDKQLPKLPSIAPWNKDCDLDLNTNYQHIGTINTIYNNTSTITIVNNENELSWNSTRRNNIINTSRRISYSNNSTITNYNTSNWTIVSEEYDDEIISHVYIDPSITNTSNWTIVSEYDDEIISHAYIDPNITSIENTKSIKVSVNNIESINKENIFGPMREQKEIKSSIVHCRKCNKVLIGSNHRTLCDKCFRLSKYQETKNEFLRHKRNRFNLMTRNYFSYIPWFDKPKSRPERIKIPWLRKLNSRIYDDYMRELRYGEEDYSSYLTNMHWLGIH